MCHSVKKLYICIEKNNCMDSAANLLERYIFILSMLNNAGDEGMTIAQIGNKWERRFGKNSFVERTFHRQREAIGEVFPVRIEFSRESGKPKYYLRSANGTSSAQKLAFASMNSFLLGNELSHDRLPMDRMYLSSSYCNRYTALIAEAVRDSKMIEFRYTRSKEFYRRMVAEDPMIEHSPEEMVDVNIDYKFCPYAIAYESFWFVVGVIPGNDRLMVFTLERLSDVVITEDSFIPDPEFEYSKIRNSGFGNYLSYPSELGGGEKDDRMLYLTVLSDMRKIEFL